jgi:hypothetical protein
MSPAETSAGKMQTIANNFNCPKPMRTFVAP